MGCEEMGRGLSSIGSTMMGYAETLEKMQTRQQTAKLSSMLAQKMGPEFSQFATTDPSLLTAMISAGKQDYMEKYYAALAGKADRTDPNASANSNVGIKPTVWTDPNTGISYTTSSVLDKKTGKTTTHVAPLDLPAGVEAVNPSMGGGALATPPKADSGFSFGNIGTTLKNVFNGMSSTVPPSAAAATPPTAIPSTTPKTPISKVLNPKKKVRIFNPATNTFEDQ